MNGIKCKHCPGYQECSWRDPEDDTCWFEPNDYDGKDIGTATAIENELQNSTIKLSK